MNIKQKEVKSNYEKKGKKISKILCAVSFLTQSMSKGLINCVDFFSHKIKSES
jgi:hypothetical protein